MPDYRRYYVPGSLIFITCVTFQRIPYLEGEENLALFWETLRTVQEIHPFHLLAYVVLPDHFHWLMQMPEDLPDFSIVIHSVKRNFSINLKKAHGIESTVHLWQDRYWDHLIRSETDLENHIHYIHWNPVKHGHAKDPTAWTQSSIGFWISKGMYPASWGIGGEPGNLHGFLVDE